MATLEKTYRKKMSNILLFLFLLVAELVIAPYMATAIDRFLQSIFKVEKIVLPGYTESWKLLFAYKNVQIWWVVLQLIFTISMVYLFWIFPIKGKVKDIKTIKITEDIEIPAAVGNGQYGTARFMTKKEREQTFSVHRVGEAFTGSVGIALNMEKKGGNEYITYNTVSPHSLIIGATGAGKTRRILLETMYLQMLAGVSVICSDVKGELYHYTHSYALQHGYEILPLDFRNPQKSVHYNYLQPVIDAFDKGNEALAVEATWDLVSAIVQESKGEPLWYNGESATIAAAILIVARDAPRECRNCTNVYYFLAYMCQANSEGIMPINEYMSQLDSSHPAKGVFAAAQVAPNRTRASFFTSALATLRLFTNPLLAEMTSKSDFHLQEICERKAILYMIVPDEKKTLYPLVSVFISQAYMSQVETANQHGARLPIDVHYDLDELGNFPRIPVLANMFSAGRSRGIYVNGILQDYQQLEQHYKEEYRNIKSNAQCKVYLKSDDMGTLRDFSENMGKYTVEAPSVSSSVSSGRHGNASYSSSSGMMGRELLTPGEIGKIKYPYALCTVSGENPTMCRLPDISEYSLNAVLGLGDEEHNRALIQRQEEQRPQRHNVEMIKLWGIWDKYQMSSESPEESMRTKKKFSNIGKFI